VIRTVTALASALRDEGRPCERVRVAGIDALVARPAAGSGPAVVFANAATPRGIEQPAVARVLSGLARAGFVAVAPELPRVRDGVVTPQTVEALVAVARSAGPRVTLLGASTGAGLAILAASDPLLANRVSGVMAIAPFASLERILKLGTTGFYGDRPYPAAPLVARATMRSLAATAPDDPGVAPLLANRDPDRFDELFAALDPATRAVIVELSPSSRIGRISAPVELVSAPDDAYVPVEESKALAELGTDVRLTVTRSLVHVVPRPRPGLVRVVAALDRTLRRSTDAEPVAVLQPSPAL
jgi:pimeloyl-ACP methyl ester carboxylesterase